MVGVKQNTVSSWEKDRNYPETPETIKKLAEILGLKASDIETLVDAARFAGSSRVRDVLPPSTIADPRLDAVMDKLDKLGKDVASLRAEVNEVKQFRGRSRNVRHKAG